MVVRTFTAQHPKLTLDAIQKAHVVAYKDKLVGAKKQVAPTTIKKRLAALHSLLEYAQHQGPKVSPRTRQHIPLEDLNKLFGSPVFIHCWCASRGWKG
jgi:hypothetical protein